MIRLFVGCSANNEDLEAQAVLEYTARRHASERIDITWMQLSRDKQSPYAGWRSDRWTTPFTGFRWSIPAVCGYEGRAIYCDVDFLFCGDLAELWHQETSGRVLLLRNPDGKLKTCCMLIDCAAAKGHIPQLEELRRSDDTNAAVSAYFRDRRELVAAFDGDWNCVDAKGYNDLTDPRLKAIHYSRIETQLHLKYAMPRLAAQGREHWYQGEIRSHWRPDLVERFDGEYAAALAAGFTLDRYVVPPYGPYRKRNFVYKVHRGEARA